ncbi:MAG TPA: exodeoxyribonuclease VII small subunit [Myxococcota bacterium]|nr:exodeoxyribonuclease VII small subunit [Myxococcota bacterium]
MPRRARPDDPPASPEAAPFEASLERLEAIVAELESGDLDLEVSLARFEEGVALSRRCADQLGEARQRIDVLVADNGELFERPFEGDDGALDEPDA